MRLQATKYIHKIIACLRVEMQSSGAIIYKQQLCKESWDRIAIVVSKKCTQTVFQCLIGYTSYPQQSDKCAQVYAMTTTAPTAIALIQAPYDKRRIRLTLPLNKRQPYNHIHLKTCMAFRKHIYIYIYLQKTTEITINIIIHLYM